MLAPEIYLGHTYLAKVNKSQIYISISLQSSHVFDLVTHLGLILISRSELYFDR